MKEIKIAVIVGTKGRGSNMKAIIEGCESGKIYGKVVVVIGSNPDSLALQYAKKRNLNVFICDPSKPLDAKNLLDNLTTHEVDLICLAGYMKLIHESIIEKFQNKILNIHPALLPKYGGKGMYGMKVHKEVIMNKDRISGCTVHIVTERYDEGEILLQKQCEVLENDTPESLAERVLKLEHELYIEAINKWQKELFN
jgi:phosphoribosylglycinamide formyltransferase-1